MLIESKPDSSAVFELLESFGSFVTLYRKNFGDLSNEQSEAKETGKQHICSVCLYLNASIERHHCTEW